jgi:hypothetical protein
MVTKAARDERVTDTVRGYTTLRCLHRQNHREAAKACSSNVRFYLIRLAHGRCVPFHSPRTRTVFSDVPSLCSGL